MTGFGKITTAAVIVAAISGCSREHRPLPSARNELVSRFFQSLESGNAEAAAQQGRKLIALAPTDEFILPLVEIQESNTAIFHAQEAINAQDIPKAIEILSAAVKKYPENRTLHRARSQVRQLNYAPSLIQGMEKVRTPESMSAALTSASTGLAANITPKLRRYFDNYEKRIDGLEKAAKTEQK